MMFRRPMWIPLLGAMGAAVILLVSAIAADRVREQNSRFAAAQIETHLRALSRSIENVHADRLRLARAVAERPAVRELVGRLLSADDAEAAALSLGALLMEEVPKLGLSGFELYDDSFRVVAASNPGLIGTQARPQPHQLERLRLTGTVVTPPLGPVQDDASPINQRAAGFSELICSEVRPKGLLCLAADPRALLLALLDSGHVGESGEAYLIDRNARLRTPSRFETDLPNAAEDHNPRLLSRALARVPPEPDRELGTLRLPSIEDPLTEIAARLIAEPAQATGVMEDYLDYRRVPVVGAGVWLEHADLGLLLEVDAAEVHASSTLAAAWVWALGVTAAAILLLLSWTYARSRRALALSESALRGFLQNAPVGMDIQTADGQFLRFNHTMLDFFGLKSEQVVGRREEEVSQFDAKIVAERREQRRQVLSTRQPLLVSKQVRDHRGSMHHVQVVNFPLLVPGSDEVYAMGTVATDITEQVESQQALHALASRLEKEVEERTHQLCEARDAAERAGEAKADFLASMSHEIRTPLNAISGMAHLARRRNKDPVLDRYLARLLASSQHLLGIVNDVLDFSALEAHKLTPESTVFSPEELAIEVAALVGERATVKGLDMMLEVQPTVPQQVVGDAKRIRQVLINFAANAIKFTESGFVQLGITSSESRKDRVTLKFSVEDSGAGIEAEDLARLFLPFEQLRTPGKRAQEGTGLGLAISKRLAEALEGRVLAESTPGKGSLFALELSLPVVEEAQADRSGVADARRALVVDHSRRSGQATQAHLQRLGVEADLVEDSALAMQRLVEQAQTPSDNHYDVVLLDEVMPGLDGPGMARRILALPWTAQRPRLLLVSPPGMLGHDGRSGCDGGVSKPLSARQLGAALDRLDPSPSHAGTPSGVSRQETALHGLRVLLVEDNEVNREVAGDLLRLEGVVVGEAHNGADAIAVLRTQEFDAVLMDINMPVMDGIAATRAIRADPALAGNVIIGLSASVLPGDRDSCLAAGMDDFLGKPVIPAQLYETLRRLLGKTEHPADAAPTSTLADAVEALASTPQLQRLRGIQQLDVTAALGRLEGHEALYLRLVQRVLADRRLEGGALIAAQRAGDQEAAIRFSHNLASIAGSLGADMLRERCRALEKSLHAGQRDAQLVADVVEQSAALWRSLQQAFADTDDDIAGEQRSVR